MKDKKKSKNATVSSWWEERHKILQSTIKNKSAKKEVKIKKDEAKKETADLPALELSQLPGLEAFLLIGDVHANLPALKAVLEDAINRGVSEIWNVGDLTGYGAFPDNVVRRLRKENAKSVAGNYDLKVLKVKEKKEEGEGEKEETPEDRNAIKWTYDNLSKRNRKYLKSLPEELRLESGGKRILLTHRSPLHGDEQIGPETPDEKLHEFAQLADADVIIFGHSHRPFSRQVDGVWFINPGGAGRQDDGDPRASYAILQIDPFEVKHYRVDYDVEKAAAAIRENGLPEFFAQMALQGLSPEGVAQELIKKNETRLEEILKTARSVSYNEGHSSQVTRLAMRLFDELGELHGLGAEERFWLQCAGILHDIGWIEGQKGHHKTSLRIILAEPHLPFDERERNIVGSIARYHRRKLPNKGHRHFAALRRDERQKVKALSAILRVADGLDFTQQSIVKDITSEFSPEQVTINCAVSGEAETEKKRAMKKGDLFEKVFNRDLAISLDLVS
ncbi:MAG: YfcE family phosphodiesterase [Candidatus Methanoperedens sp.]|nr:YfcE family phosphodiesterase [Candidatus Methanoperedens sp.]MCE8428660.1 YfcE family phosphodiesterase [Candidatus Methanoperedens sp.]